MHSQTNKTAADGVNTGKETMKEYLNSPSALCELLYQGDFHLTRLQLITLNLKCAIAILALIITSSILN